MAVSTGANLQQSSRLLSAVNASGLAFLPAQSTVYECKGKTQVVLLEENVGKLQELTPEEFNELVKKHETSFLISTGCSGACASASTLTQEGVKKSSAKFGVFCLTVSDRAAKGGYEHGDLSGKAMIECIESNDSFKHLGSKIVSDEKADIQGAIREAL